jgi:hypothetical protein
LEEDEVLAAVSDPSEWETGWTGSDRSKHPQVRAGRAATVSLCMFTHTHTHTHTHMFRQAQTQS